MTRLFVLVLGLAVVGCDSGFVRACGSTCEHGGRVMREANFGEGICTCEAYRAVIEHVEPCVPIQGDTTE